MTYIVNADCFDEFKNIADKTIDLVVVDLPYGQTDCEWDVKINLNQMWSELKRICKYNAMYVFFTTTKFGYELINSNPRWFRYDLVWEKSRTVGYLSANKMPLRTHEMIYIFADVRDDDLDNCRNLNLRAYAEKVKNYINRPRHEIDALLGNQGVDHFFRSQSTQFGLPTKSTYDKLIETFHIDQMDGFCNLDDLKAEWEGGIRDRNCYNPQKTPGKPYKVKGHKTHTGVYGKQTSVPDYENPGDRHPTSVLKFNNPSKSLHPTQKPTDLCEWLIKTYSNEGDVVLDFCMGSGSTIIACLNTNRKYIGIEKDSEIFKVAEKRINENSPQPPAL